MNKKAIVTGTFAIAIAQGLAGSACAQDRAPSVDPAQDRTELPKVEVHERRSQDDTRPKLQHIMKEVDGPLITVTKKTSITKLDAIPTVVDNNLRALFAQTPGLLVSEQQTPGQYNLSYRGIGNPQESEFVTVLQDGIPLEARRVDFVRHHLPAPLLIVCLLLLTGSARWAKCFPQLRDVPA